MGEAALFIGIGIGLAVGAFATWLWASRQQLHLQSELKLEQAKAEEKARSFEQQLAQSDANKAGLKIEFENLSRELLAARDKELRDANKDSLGAILKPLAEKIDGFQHRVNQVHTDMVQNSASLIQQIKQLETVGLSISADAQHLTDALKGDIHFQLCMKYANAVLNREAFVPK